MVCASMGVPSSTTTSYTSSIVVLRKFLATHYTDVRWRLLVVMATVLQLPGEETRRLG